jgi:hypothetical protein
MTTNRNEVNPLAVPQSPELVSPGRIVLVREYLANEQDEHPAIVTRASGLCVNVTLFPDTYSPVVLTSVMHQSAPGEGYRWRWPREERLVAIDQTIELADDGA